MENTYSKSHIVLLPNLRLKENKIYFTLKSPLKICIKKKNTSGENKSEVASNSESNVEDEIVKVSIDAIKNLIQTKGGYSTKNKTKKRRTKNNKRKTMKHKKRRTKKNRKHKK